MKFFKNISRNKRFYGTIGSLNVGAVCIGLAMGWPNPSFTYFYNARGDPSLSYLDAAWMEAAINVGASFGSLGSIFITDIYGRRTSFHISGMILTGFWLMLASAGVDKIMIISAALVAGFGVGIYAATAVLYVAEVSSPGNRGIVGAAVILFSYLGIFSINFLAHVLRVTSILSVMVTMPMLFLVTMHFYMIESPYYLFQEGKVLKAKIALKNLRDCRTVLQVDKEYKSMEAFFNSNFCKNPGQLLLESMCPKSLRSMTTIVIPVLCISQMLGLTAASDYAQNLLEATYPMMGKLLTSFIDVVSIICCLFAIERFGRKPLLVFSSLGSGVCCLLLSINNLADEGCSTSTEESDYKTVPLAIICIYYAIYALGLTPVLPIVTGEIFPCRAKTAAVGICTSLLYLLAFLIQVSYSAMNKKTSSCLAFATFTMLGSIGLPFAITLLPETRGKSLLQIQNELENFVVTNY